MSSLTPSRRSRRAPRTDPGLRHRQLVQVAIRSFAELGYAGVQLEAIAQEVGVTRNLIHHYFPGGKRDLYLEAVRAAWQGTAATAGTSRS